MHEYVMANFGKAQDEDSDLEPGAIGLAKAALDALDTDADALSKIHDYCTGNHIKPFAPRDASDELRATQNRSITNLIPLVTSHPSQVLRVEGYRRGTFGDPDAIIDDALRFPDEWEDWQRNRLDARQHLIYETALKYGRTVVLADNVTSDELRVDVLPARRTIPFFRDPANDVRPEAVVILRRVATEGRPGLIHVWDREHFYQLAYDNKALGDGDFALAAEPIPHNADGCPAVRYHCFIDDEGTVEGIVERVISSQDRLNQSVFDTNILSSHGAFKVRTAAGLNPSYKTDANGDLLLDSMGNPIPEPVKVSQARMLVSTNKDTKFSTLDETPLDGHLAAEDTSMRNFAITAQLPPHVFLGNLSNLSAEALDAAEVSFHRFIEYLQGQFADSHEELFRIICELKDDTEGAGSYGGEVRWADISLRSFAAWMDGLAKGVDSLQIPIEAAWSMVPGQSSQRSQTWRAMREKEMTEQIFEPSGGIENAATREFGPTVVRAEQEATPRGPVF